MIVVIPRTGPQGNCGTFGVAEQEWLPRICPRCGQPAIVGHGRRSKQAHDETHTRIRVRRGLCHRRHQTITVLPVWSLPYTHYSLQARQHSLHQIADGSPLEQAAPPVRDSDRFADPATVRRWVQRRLASLWACTAAMRVVGRWAAMLSPTIFAWDRLAAARILILEPKPS